jgi:GalNAc-alpha-(1->4)-GalNAc-alpha-(1->3)-diNAcBac-PP-undecaprenol alpha-1,4-N-acetyl-D-galactosaminyltransferase
LTDLFIKRGILVDIATFKKNKKKYHINKNINIITIKDCKILFKNLNRIIKIRKLIKDGEYDIIIGFAIIPSVICSLASIGLKIPVVVCERNDPAVYPKLWKIIRSIAYKFANAAVFQTKDASDCFSNKYFSKRTVIRNPLEIEKIPNPDFKFKKKVIVNTSRLTTAKNHELLIKAFINISIDYPEYKLEIYGDGPLREKLTKIINSYRLEDKIKLYKAIPDVLDKIKNSDIFVLPSNHEGFPNSLAEAMAIGIPSISTNCRIGGPKDIITDKVDGLLIPVNDIYELEKALRLLIGDRELNKKVAKNSQRIKEKLAPEKIVDTWISFLETIITVLSKKPEIRR